MDNTIGRTLLVYTATAGLGDYIVLGTLLRQIKKSLPQCRAIIVHRGNRHVHLWPVASACELFFNAHAAVDLLRLARTLRQARNSGVTVFGLQMAPGSLQGFFFHTLLKRCGLLDYIVDFNLINADIITPPSGDYIHTLHARQLESLLRIPQLPKPDRDDLPLAFPAAKRKGQHQFTIGIHPWSRRSEYGSFIWSEANWLKLIAFLLDNYEANLILFGKTKDFLQFQDKITRQWPADGRIHFQPSANVPSLVQTIDSLDLLVSVNTSVIHIGHLLGKKMVVLSGPSLDLWIPKGDHVSLVRDETALFPGNDRWTKDSRFPRIDRITLTSVCETLTKVLPREIRRPLPQEIIHV